MTLEWYCKIMGDVWGPMSAQEILAVARFGRLSRDDTVRRGPEGNWVRAELVKGLFSNGPHSPTGTAAGDRLDVSSTSSSAEQPTARPARPAKRSVAVVSLPKFWVRRGSQMAGPYSEPQVRQLAAEGKLKPDYLLSKDRRRWVRACQVKGLAFGGASPQASTMSIRSAVWPLTEFAPGLSVTGEESGGVDEVLVADADV